MAFTYRTKVSLIVVLKGFYAFYSQPYPNIKNLPFEEALKIKRKQLKD